jgi:hypothetical protein
MPLPDPVWREPQNTLSYIGRQRWYVTFVIPPPFVTLATVLSMAEQHIGTVERSGGLF